MTDDPQRERYEAALQVVVYEGQLLWTVFGAFLLAHTVFLAVLLQGVGDARLPSNISGGFWPAVIGLFLCIPWITAYLYRSKWYNFRMAQARDAEPDGWNLVAGVAKEFADGHEVRIAGEWFQQRGLPRALRTKQSAPLLVAVFAIGYITVLIVTGPWW
jgi:hypothetical protein